MAGEVPQANRADLILRLVVPLSHQTLTTNQIRAELEKFNAGTFVARQAGYYASAGVTLGIFIAVDDGWRLTRRGLEIAACPTDEQKTAAFSTTILKSPLIRTIIDELELTDSQLPTQDAVGDWLQMNTDLGASTSRRRASSICSLIKYARENK